MAVVYNVIVGGGNNDRRTFETVNRRVRSGILLVHRGVSETKGYRKKVVRN